MAKVRKVLHSFASAMGKFWGIPPIMARWAWRGIARPMLTHGSLVWGHVVDQTWAMKLLTKTQRAALKLLTFFRSSTPTMGLEVMLNLWPMDLFIKYLQAGSFLRTRGFQKFTDNQMYTPIRSLKGHRQRVEEWLYYLGAMRIG